MENSRQRAEKHDECTTLNQERGQDLQDQKPSEALL